MKNLLLLLSLVAIGLQILKITMLNDLYSEGIDYTSLIAQVKTLHDENIELHDIFLQDSSYHLIDQEAHARGFVKAAFVDLQNNQQ